MVNQIKIPLTLSSPRVFFQVYVEKINYTYNLQLTQLEIKVLGELLYHNDVYSDIAVKERMEIIFSTRIRKDMQMRLKITEHSLNNVLARLRKTEGVYGKVIIDNELNTKYTVPCLEETELIFQLKVKR